MDINKKLKLQKVINASGKMTKLGVSGVSDEVAETVSHALKSYFHINEMMIAVGRVVADVTGSEDGCPTVGAAAGISIATAAIITEGKNDLVARMPDSNGLKNEILIPKGHIINFGADIRQMIKLGGGIPVEVGTKKALNVLDIESSITPQTAALIYVKSHSIANYNMAPIEQILDVAHKYGLPLIVDAAAEYDFKKYISMGVDIVIYSGAKALAGPTSGFVCGKSFHMEACRAQYNGIARAMKIGKEGMAGLVAALLEYPNRVMTEVEQINKLNIIKGILGVISGIRYIIIQDEAGREIYRGRIEVIEDEANLSAIGLQQALLESDPSIVLRSQKQKEGILDIDPRDLRKGQEKEIAFRIKNIVEGATK
ncbi:L-seryl-tRNA(Ser) seleniumtransferase/D-glucosaminate-6-phosphate ammonia-lyase [Virgibacillus halotolerans]|uniref:DgaE family pyridoxal phosphate-dependent ammonia lyase n=1 Tax=Virgibacillus halotolerans TaxID=1071053 RepID=UPI00195F425A|nr:DgaE family pyridoxal phosphate-dependent ammonia lyase [Virgibacillus halotolerans]MBM7599029.1 L-seryl-tRNA(Ser) seleniumtransferase/D-glucosaminate-6-phosphate ammonia-lyase [Virgibacillus halotolerans]